MLTIQMNIVSKGLNLFMTVTLTVIRLRSGLYTVSYNTQYANMIIFDTPTKVKQAVAILVLDICLIATALYDISEQRKEQQMIEDARKREA
jgi:hypothetical protein